MGAEFLGTTLLILLGNGVVANVVLSKTKGERSGWIVITTGWGAAVFVAVLCVGDISGAHINPAVTIALAVAERFPWSDVVGYVSAQLLGAMLGAILVYCFYRDHYATTQNADLKLATFGTVPQIRNYPSNLFSEVIGTFVLVLGVLSVSSPSLSLNDGAVTTNIKLGAIEALPVGLLVFSIGICLGGTTGYAINPARDLGPRVIHAILSIPGKRDSDWKYSWIPIVGPLVGGFLAALVWVYIQES